MRRKKIISIVLIICFSFFSTSLNASQKESDRIKAEAAASGAYHATSISMVFWGVLLVAGIAVAAIFINSHSE